MNHAIYWKIRRFFSSFVFFLRKLQYKSLNKKEQWLFKKPLKTQILKTIIGRLFLSCIVVAIMVAFLHFFNNAACDSLYRQISAENKIDKKRITPNWFVKQTVAKQIHIYLGERLQDVERIIDVYKQAGQALHEKKQTYCAAVFLAHCFEVISYCEQIIESINAKLPLLKQMHVEKSYTWEEFTSQRVKDALNNLVNDVPALLIKNSGSFAIRNWNDREKKPDFLGMCYNHLCEHLVRAIETNDYAKFEALYRDFFSLTLLYQE